MEESVLIYQDKNAHQQIKDAWDTQKGALQRVIDLYNAMRLPALAGNDLAAMFTDTETLLFDKLAGGEKAYLTIGTGEDRTHLPVDKHQAIALLTKPAGYQLLLAGIKQFAESSLKVTGATIHANSIGQYFCIDESGLLQFTERVNYLINEAGCHYIQSDGGKKVYAFVQAAVKAYYENEVHKVSYPHGGNIGDIINEVVRRMDDVNKTFVPDLSFCNTAKQLR